MRVKWHDPHGPQPAYDGKGNPVLNNSGRVLQFLPSKDASKAKAVVLSDKTHSQGVFWVGKRFRTVDIGDLAVDPPDKL